MAADVSPTFDEWKYEELLDLLDQFVECGVQSVGLTGGEPMLHPRFADILREIAKRKLTLSELCTNAALVTDEICEEIKSLGFSPMFRVSFDGGEKDEYHLTLTHGDVSLSAVLTAEKTSFGRTSFRILDRGGLAFDHAAIIAAALTALRNEAKNYEAVFDFLPETFTLSALQKVQETITNVSMLPANFRRMVSGYVEETDEYVRGEGHRPAKLYRRKRNIP